MRHYQPRVHWTEEAEELVRGIQERFPARELPDSERSRQLLLEAIDPSRWKERALNDNPVAEILGELLPVPEEARRRLERPLPLAPEEGVVELDVAVALVIGIFEFEAPRLAVERSVDFLVAARSLAHAFHVVTTAALFSPPGESSKEPWGVLCERYLEASDAQQAAVETTALDQAAWLRKMFPLPSLDGSLKLTEEDIARAFLPERAHRAILDLWEIIGADELARGLEPEGSGFTPNLRMARIMAASLSGHASRGSACSEAIYLRLLLRGRPGDVARVVQQDAFLARAAAPLVVKHLGVDAFELLSPLALEPRYGSWRYRRHKTLLDALCLIESDEVARFLAPCLPPLRKERYSDTSDRELWETGALSYFERFPHLAFRAYHRHELEPLPGQDFIRRLLTRLFAPRPGLLQELEPELDENEARAAAVLSRRLSVPGDAGDGELPLVLRNPPWRREPRVRRGLTRSLEWLPHEEKIDWSPEMLELAKSGDPSRGIHQDRRFWYGDILWQLLHHGLDVLPRLVPGVNSWIRACGVEQVTGVDSPRVARTMARMCERPWRWLTGERWLLRYPRAAAVGLIPDALGPGNQGGDERRALRFLAYTGRADELLEVASEYGEDAKAALIAFLAEDGTDDLPRGEPSLPDFLDLRQVPCPMLAGRARSVSFEATVELTRLLSCCRHLCDIPWLREIREACDGESLREYSWGLVDAWAQSGCPHRHKWMVQASGRLGDDETVGRLSRLMGEKPRGWNALCVSGVADCLMLIGTEQAVKLLRRLVCDNPGDSRTRRDTWPRLELRALVQRMDAEDLRDQLVPHLGLGLPGGNRRGEEDVRVVLQRPLVTALVDAEGGKVAPVSGDSLSRERRYAWADMRGRVRRIGQAEIPRLKSAMVQRRRWIPRLFREHILANPLLALLAEGLLWGVFGTDGELLRAFRVLPGGMCVDLSGNEIPWTLMEDPARIGIVDPRQCRLSDLAAWREAFERLGMVQPFRQLDR